MLHKVRNGCMQILDGLPELKSLLPPGERVRMRLREMAESGLPRPSQKTKIGRTLSDYTSPANRSYVPGFHREMKAIRPDWFLSQSQIASQKKEQLLDMARKGLPRPSHDKTKIGQALSNYTRKSSQVYDPDFDRKIRALRPDWFTPQPNNRP